MVTIIKLSKSFFKNDKEYTQLAFDFEKLTGYDLIQIEQTCRLLDKDEFQLWGTKHILYIAGRACEGLNVDDLLSLSMKDCMKIQMVVMNFFNDVVSTAQGQDISEVPF